jgi:hypothetical protein
MHVHTRPRPQLLCTGCLCCAARVCTNCTAATAAAAATHCGKHAASAAMQPAACIVYAGCIALHFWIVPSSSPFPWTRLHAPLHAAAATHCGGGGGHSVRVYAGYIVDCRLCPRVILLRPHPDHCTFPGARCVDRRRHRGCRALTLLSPVHISAICRPTTKICKLR